METETTVWSKFPTGEKTTIEQIIRPEEINPKDQDVSHDSEMKRNASICHLQTKIITGLKLMTLKDYFELI